MGNNRFVTSNGTVGTAYNVARLHNNVKESRVAIQLAILDRLNHGLNHRPTGFYTGNAPKYAPK